MTAYYYLPILVVSTNIIVFFIGVFVFRKLTAEMKMFVVLLGLGAITEGAILILLFFGKIIQWPHNIYAPVQYALYSYILSHWQKSLLAKKLILLSIPIYIMISIYSTFKYYHFYQMDSFSISLSFVLYAIISSYTLYIMQMEDAGGIFSEYKFWILSGILLYSAGGLTYFALNDLIAKHYVLILYIMHVIWYIITYVVYSVGILRQFRERKLCGV